jgi:Dyp-type peroxidase family
VTAVDRDPALIGGDFGADGSETPQEGVHHHHPVDVADIQGNILRGYHKPFVRHLVVRVADARAARAWLRDATSGDPGTAPQITNAETWDERPPWCLNVGVTFPGLGALGLPAAQLATFPEEFRAGMPARAVRIGDVGDSAPENWLPGFRDTGAVHLVISIHADDEATRAEISTRVLQAAGGRAFRELSHHDGQTFDQGKVHFGYRDNIAQPNLSGIPDPDARSDRQPLAPLGTLLLGHATPLENMRWQIPEPEVLGRNGCFNAFRILEQKVDDFEQFLSDSADTLLRHPGSEILLPAGEERHWGPDATRHDAMREVVAARVMGRWRNGVPLDLSPTTAFPDPPIVEERLNDFDFLGDDAGTRCPIGSHIRRCNPRNARIVQRSTNHFRRIVRRGIPYGPPYEPTTSPDGSRGSDGIERGLLGVFLCASLAVQFELIQYDWMNLGLQDPRITGTNDPIVGTNEPTYSSFSMPVGDETIELRGFPRFVQTRGGAYCFLPTISGLRHLGSLD